MAYDIGPKIGIDGEAEFRQQLNNITQSLKTMDKEMEATTSAFGKNNKSQKLSLNKTKYLTNRSKPRKRNLRNFKKG